MVKLGSSALALSQAAPQWPGLKNWAQFEVCSLWLRVGCKLMCATDPRTARTCSLLTLVRSSKWDFKAEHQMKMKLSKHEKKDFIYIKMR